MADDLVLALGDDDRVLHLVPNGKLPTHIAPVASTTSGQGTVAPLSTPPMSAGSGPPGVPGPITHDHALDHQTLGVDGTRLVAWQYYDETGQQLVQGPTGDFSPLPGNGPISEDELLQRISHALGYLQAILDTSDDAVIRNYRQRNLVVPRPTGTLTEVMDSLRIPFGFYPAGTTPNDGGWLHRLAHAAGFAHW